MELEWDQAKDQHNIEKHGIGFEAVRGFDWESALIYRNYRKGEHRWVAVGYIGSRLHRIAYADQRERSPDHQSVQGKCTGEEAL